MTAKEFANLTAAIKTYYPRDYVIPTDKAMELWFNSLKDLDYQNACRGLKKYVETNKFPPSIADIREYADASKPHVVEIEEKHVGVPMPEHIKKKWEEMWK